MIGITEFRKGQEAGRQAVRTKRVSFAITSIIGLGVFRLFRAWQHHNFNEGFAVTIIFLIVFPTLILRSTRSERNA
jgi:hypothetical protein